MGRRVARLTLDNLSDLPAHSQECLFWELDPVRRQQARGHEREEKAAWLSMVLREWGSCGRVVYVDDVYAGHMIWAPPVHVPGAAAFATAPVSTDAVLLVTGYVEPSFRGGGLGRVLVQVMAKDVLRHGGIRAVEAFGDTRERSEDSGRHFEDSGHCVLPADFLLAVGFCTHRAHASYPRMRMQLHSTVSWRTELEAALDRLRGAVGTRRPATLPSAPAGPSTPRGAR